MISCTSPADNLDKLDPVLRSVEHTTACKAAFDAKVMWEKYGVVNDVTVGPIPVRRFGFKLIAAQPFTNNFPNADIYELITPDLLHQLIKGVFKDCQGHSAPRPLQETTRHYESLTDS